MLLPRNHDELPWARLTHFYGRATEIPTLLDALRTDASDTTAARLAHVLEHQDGVTQATPFAVYYLCGALRNGLVSNTAALMHTLGVIHRAAQFMQSSPARPEVTLSLVDLIAESRLWPAYVSDEDDEVLWEEWAPDSAEYYGWAVETCRLIAASGLLVAA